MFQTETYKSISSNLLNNLRQCHLMFSVEFKNPNCSQLNSSYDHASRRPTSVQNLDLDESVCGVGLCLHVVVVRRPGNVLG